jgi:thiamine-phosphate pyrophosphorylase
MAIGQLGLSGISAKPHLLPGREPGRLTLLLYYISDRRQLPGTPAQQRASLLQKIAEAARAGVDFVQLREKDLTSRELEKLARDAVAAVRNQANAARPTRLLINSRPDIAISAGLDGVHLPAGELEVQTARKIFDAAGFQGVVGVSCHSADDAGRAAAAGADYCVIGPVIGLAGLAAACRMIRDSRPDFPLLALGGISPANAASCIAAGASGVAGIRLFQHADLAGVVRVLRLPAGKGESG